MSFAPNEPGHHHGSPQVASHRKGHEYHRDGIGGPNGCQRILTCKPARDATVRDIVKLLEHDAYKHGQRKPPQCLFRMLRRQICNHDTFFPPNGNLCTIIPLVCHKGNRKYRGNANLKRKAHMNGPRRKALTKYCKSAKKTPGAFPFTGFAPGAVFSHDKSISGGRDGFP